MPDIYPPNKKPDDNSSTGKNNNDDIKNQTSNNKSQNLNSSLNTNKYTPNNLPNNTPAWNSNPPNSFNFPYSGNNVWGGNNSYGNNNNWGSNKPGSNKPLTPDEKTEVVKKIYKEVFNRKATTRDINYYKYSTLDENAMFKQLVNSKEHKELIKKGKDYKDIKSRADEAEGKVRQLKAQIKDQVEEFKKLTHLLKEKNRYIHQLRQKCNNPYNLINPPVSKKPHNPPERQNQPSYRQPNTPTVQ